MIPPLSPMDLHDMEELIPGNKLCELYGTNEDELRYDQDEIQNIEEVLGLVLAPVHMPDPCGGRSCDECEIGGCEVVHAVN